MIDEEDVKFTPQECEFGIITNYFTFSGDCKHVGIFIMPIDKTSAVNREVYDRVDRSMLPTHPKWLPEFEDSECMWEIPANVSKEQAIKDMQDLGYTYNLSMGWDMS